jgi:hypothetical protein
MMETLSSYDTSVLTRATRRNNPEPTILHSHRRENLKSYDLFILLVALTLHLEMVGLLISKGFGCVYDLIEALSRNLPEGAE